VRDLGIHTMFVGTDDELGQTSLGGVDLYPDVLAHLTALRRTSAITRSASISASATASSA
jgi:hypothetical protein